MCGLSSRAARRHVQAGGGRSKGAIDVYGLRGQSRPASNGDPSRRRDVAGIVGSRPWRATSPSSTRSCNPTGCCASGPSRARSGSGLATAPRDARVLLLALSGAITSDLPLAERAGFGPRFREGTFGTAQPLLSANAVRGDIVLTVEK